MWSQHNKNPHPHTPEGLQTVAPHYAKTIHLPRRGNTKRRVTIYKHIPIYAKQVHSIFNAMKKIIDPHHSIFAYTQTSTDYKFIYRRIFINKATLHNQLSLLDSFSKKIIHDNCSCFFYLTCTLFFESCSFTIV